MKLKTSDNGLNQLQSRMVVQCSAGWLRSPHNTSDFVENDTGASGKTIWTTDDIKRVAQLNDEVLMYVGPIECGDEYEDVVVLLTNLVRPCPSEKGWFAVKGPQRAQWFFPWLEPSSDLEAVFDFCRRHRVTEYLSLALDFLPNKLKSNRGVGLKTVIDPDTGDEWIVIRVVLSGEITEMLKEIDSYTERWVAEVPWPERGFIRLSYDTR